MIEFGKTLRAAREAKGLSVAQLAEATKLLSSTITDLENEDFSHIAAPIYGRGFIKLYCEAVGLDPKPLVAEFMEILNGNREAQIRERPTPPTPQPEPAPEDPLPAAEPDDFHLEAETMPKPNPPAESPNEPEDEEPDDGIVSAFPPADEQEAFAQRDSEPEAEHGLSRYAAPIRQAHGDGFPRPSYWRLVTLAAAALAVIVLLIFGIRALYHATSNPSAAETTADETATPVVSAEPAKATPQAQVPAAPRSAQKIPDLYVD